MAYLKKDAPADIAEVLRQAEAQADECWRALQIRHFPANLAVWAVSTGGIRVVEREQAARGSNTAHFDAMLGNLSRLLATAVKWALRHGQSAAELNRHWTGELSAAVEQALAKDYSHFEVCFQGFHKGRYAADVLSPSLIRFSVPGTQRDRQVSLPLNGRRETARSVESVLAVAASPEGVGSSSAFALRATARFRRHSAWVERSTGKEWLLR